jgi:phosphate transport system ATP-binding protein
VVLANHQAHATISPSSSWDLADAPATVTLAGVQLYYGTFRAVKDVELTLPAQAITAIIGPSGCGKSTVLRAVNRINDRVPVFRVEGHIRIGDTDVYDAATDPVMLRQQVGMVFQRPNPFPMSIYDNVAYGPRLFDKLPRAELDETVEWALTHAGLWDEVKDHLGQSGLGLSGGQQQRLCIARAIATHPEVLLMDEPCSALDPLSTVRVEELMRDVKVISTIVIVTHNMQQAARASDHCFLMNVDPVDRAGYVVEFGTTAQIFHSPREEATRRYISGQFG